METKPKKALVIGRHKTVPIPATIQSVPKYPSKLTIFRIPASPFYWARYYDSGRIFKRTTKTDQTQEAFKAAIAFYEELLVRKTGGLMIGKTSRFEVCAKEMLKLQESRIKRGELSASLNVNEQSRLRVHMLPFFRAYDVGQIDYTVIETYLNTLTEKGLKVATLKLHESLLRKVLKHAHRKQIIPHLPDDVQEFLTKLSKKTGRNYRLPTEAEWEFAARCGNAAAYGFGDKAEDLVKYGWFDMNANEKTHEVASKLPNACGLYDMHGNVQEWTEDCWTNDYGNAPNDGRAVVTGLCSQKVVRGGTWYDPADKLRSASRQPHGYALRSRFTGFRVVRDN